jgi:DNA-binding HxlR family transcriptional regulator
MKKRSRFPVTNTDGSIPDVLHGIGNKWSFLILLVLAKRPMRFSEFRSEIDDISQRSLTEALRKLQRDGFVARDLFSATPPRVRYRLTDLGESFLGPVKLLERWAIENGVAILRHRDVFDAATAGSQK